MSPRAHDTLEAAALSLALALGIIAAAAIDIVTWLGQ